MRKPLFAIAAGSIAALGGLSFGAPAGAQDAWPGSRISVIVGFASGGFADTVGRIISKEVSDSIKQTIVVQNMPGAGSNTAARHVAVAPADGYTLLVTTTSLAINDTLYKSKGYAATDLAPIAIPVTAPESLSSSAKSDIKSFKDLERVASEGKLFVGSPGIGSGSHISTEYFLKTHAKLKFAHIPFQGGSSAIHALLTGDINIVATTAGAATTPAILRGELIGIGVASRSRYPAIPAVPTFAELGFPGFEASSWVGFFAPAATPKSVVERLSVEINAALKSNEAAGRLDKIGLIAVQRSQAETQQYYNDELKRWSDMVKLTGLAM